MVSLFRPWEFATPKDSSEVSGLLMKYGSRALIVGGGTLIHSLASRGILTEVDLLIDLRNLELDYIRSLNNSIAIGASTPFYQIQKNSAISSNFGLSALMDALSYPPPQIMNGATIGGSVASAFPLFDIPLALLALQASVKVTNSNHERNVTLDALYEGFFQTTLSKGDFISEIVLPLPTERCASAFLKLETNANDLAIVNVAVNVTFDSVNSNRCKASRIFIGGGVGSVPRRATNVETRLVGQNLIQTLIDETSQVLNEDVEMISDHRASAEYRLAVAKVLLRRALTKVLVRLRQES